MLGALRTWLAILGAFLAGCQEEPGSATGKIVIRSDAYFAGKPGEVVGPLVVQVLSAPIRGVLGRTGSRDPVPSKPVSFKVRDFEEGDPDLRKPSLTVHPDRPPMGPPVLEIDDVLSDPNGFARVFVQLPKFIGEWRVRAGVRDQFEEERTVAFGIASGTKIYTSGQENSPGKKVQVAVQVFQVDLDKAQVGTDKDRQVQFRIDGPSSGGARLGSDRLADRVKTNDEGVAIVDLTLGERSGPYPVIAEPWSNSPAEDVRLPAGVVLHGIAIDWTRAALEILGGALLFLVGLRLLGGGLLHLLGPALALPVTDFSRSRLRAFEGGLAAGAMFQSSTSVVSRLISFSNGGLLPASGAVGVILGADIGRTLLPQVLAFPVGPAGVVLLALGALGLFLPRRLGLCGWGWVLLGAGLVVVGYVFLESGVGILRISPTLREKLGGWDYCAAGLSASTRAWVFASTAVLSAAVGFLLRSSNLPVVGAIVLGNAGLLALPVALPIVLGANLGPAIALSTAAFRRRLEARRVALVQLLFQGVGALWFAALSFPALGGAPLMLHLADWLIPGALFHPYPEQVGHHLATAHTLYNVLNGFLCLVLAGPLLKLAERIIPRDPVRDDVKPYNLDPNLIEVPALAILQASREVTYLTELCRKAIAESFDSFRYRDLKLAEQTVRREESIDTVHRDLSHYLLRVGENDLSRRESSRLSILQATTGNLVRIGELGERLRDLTTREIDQNVELPEDVARDLNEIYDLVMGQFDNILQLLDRSDGRTEDNAVKVAERLAKFGSRVEQSWFEKLRLWDEDQSGVRSSDSPLVPVPSPPGQEGESEGTRLPLGDQAASGAPAGAVSGAAPEAKGNAPADGAGAGPGKAAPAVLIRTLIFRDALEALYHVAGHLSHIAERMRVLKSPSQLSES